MLILRVEIARGTSIDKAFEEMIATAYKFEMKVACKVGQIVMLAEPGMTPQQLKAEYDECCKAIYGE